MGRGRIIIESNRGDPRAESGMTYIHYKTGNRYVVEQLVIESDTLNTVVVYRNEQGITFCRPLETPGRKSWCDMVELDGVEVPRFRLLTVEDIKEKTNG